MSNYDIAAIIWPSYTGDEPRTKLFWPEGYGEWEAVKRMTDKGYAGCRWPRKPLWGYVNEADADVMEMQINAALRHGVNTFVYDWYWFDNRPFLENCLNDGFLKAPNNTRMKFYLMWANHDANYLWDIRNSRDESTVIWKGAVSEQIFDNICDRTIEKYFKKENYYCIDGCPVYMVFDIQNFAESFENIDRCVAGVARFRQKVKDAGFKDLHFQTVFFTDRETRIRKRNSTETFTTKELMEAIGFDSFTNYNWAGVGVPFDTDYTEVTDNYMNLCKEYDTWKTTHYPNITIGWDNNIRFVDFQPGVIRNNTPEAFERACVKMKAHTDERMKNGKAKAPLIIINSWNEWTETSYLEPDDLYGYGYLDAVKKVFSE